MKRNTYYKRPTFDSIYIFPKGSTNGSSLYPNGKWGCYPWTLEEILGFDHLPAVRISRKEAEKHIGRKVFRANVI